LFFCHTAPALPGSSGGPVLSEAGDVIGLHYLTVFGYQQAISLPAIAADVIARAGRQAKRT